jgi:hypothetical protein
MKISSPHNPALRQAAYSRIMKEPLLSDETMVRAAGFLAGRVERHRNMPQVKDLLDRRLARDFVGREEELALLLQTLEPDGPLVAHLYGIAGSGKSTLLDVFAQRARLAGATVIRLDCRGIEPTETGLLSELAAATGGAPGIAETIAVRLGQVGKRVVVALDTYEVFRLMDSWLRQVFVPLLPDNVRLVLCGREGPVTAWLSAPGWHGLFKAVRLDCLDHRSALEYLSRTGVPPEEAKRLEGICHGHPIALTLAASLQGSERAMALSAGVGHEYWKRSRACTSPTLRIRRLDGRSKQHR